MFLCLVSQDNVDSMTVRLMAAEEELERERRGHATTRERLHQAALELESLPLLQAQVRGAIMRGEMYNAVSRSRSIKVTSTRRGRPGRGSRGRRRTWRSS